MELIYEILGTILVGGIILWMFISAIQELKFSKEIHDKDMERIDMEIKKIEQEIQDNDAITRETIHQLKSCTKVF